MRASSAAVPVVALATLGAIVAACGAAATTSRPTARSEGANAAAASDATAAEPPPVTLATGMRDAATVMQVTLGGGPDSGMHAATSTTATCTYGLSAPGPDAADSFGNQYADDSSAGLSALELIVPDTSRTSKRGTDAFMLSVTIGRPSRGHHYRINTLPERYGLGGVAGSGSLQLDDAGATGTVRVHGRTEDGVTIDATINCNAILDASGRPRE